MNIDAIKAEMDSAALKEIVDCLEKLHSEHRARKIARADCETQATIIKHVLRALELDWILANRIDGVIVEKNKEKLLTARKTKA